MKSPAISVCIPMYNAASFLKDCIDSILSQSFTDFELLIVDDGSTDDSKDIVRSYHDDRIRLIENKHDYIGSLNMLLGEAKVARFSIIKTSTQRFELNLFYSNRCTTCML